MLHHPCILGAPQQRGENQSTKKKPEEPKKRFSAVSFILPRVMHVALTGDSTHEPIIAETLFYPLGYGPSLRNFCTRLVLVFGPIWFSSTFGFSYKKN